MSDEEVVKDEKQYSPYQELKGFEIQKVHLHQGVDLPLGGGVLTTLQTTKENPQTKTRGIKMRYTALGIACEMPHRKEKDVIHRFIIPHANVIAAFT